MSFLGEYQHSIDPKGRLIVPSKLRYELTDDQAVVTRWVDNSIALWSAEGWKAQETKLLALGQSNPQARALVRSVAASAFPEAVDKQGRILLPESLRDHAGITRECVITGAISHAEIWSPEGWAAEQAKTGDGGLDEIAAGLSF
ncbi:MAG TPA: division/cell wall cluster transcriptional repressor MraZ [Actinomycetota bacterium]|nr:division/cell wall cluster transcriptional repressor MraZ [Actinomycetota bacterium]